MNQKSQGKFLEKHTELNEDESIIYQDLWELAKSVLRGESVELNAFIFGKGIFQISNLSSYLKNLEKDPNKST